LSLESIAQEIRNEIAKLTHALRVLEGGGRKRIKLPRRKMSAAARKRISLAQKKRWAKVRAGKK
jgi:hypothetical protein